LDFFQIKPPNVQEKYMIGEKETTLLELPELKPNADNLANLDCDGDEKSSLRLPIITT